MFGRIATAAGLLLLGACTQFGGEPLPPMGADLTPETLEFRNLSRGYVRAFEQAFSRAPFADGAIAVTAPGGLGEIDTYRLVPCQGGAAICGGSESGRAGQLSRTPDWFVVTGLYGRTFWLSYGGDGYVERDGRYVPLAWNPREDGTGSGDAGSLETPYQHGYAVLDNLGAHVPAARNIGLEGLALGAPPQPTGPGRALVLGSETE